MFVAYRFKYPRAIGFFAWSSMFASFYVSFLLMFVFSYWSSAAFNHVVLVDHCRMVWNLLPNFLILFFFFYVVSRRRGGSSMLFLVFACLLFCLLCIFLLFSFLFCLPVLALFLDFVITFVCLVSFSWHRRVRAPFRNLLHTSDSLSETIFIFVGVVDVLFDLLVSWSKTLGWDIVFGFDFRSLLFLF